MTRKTNGTYKKLSRMFAIVRLLLGCQQSQSADAICERLNSQLCERWRSRTVYRDLTLLQLEGLLQSHPSGKGNVWSIAKGV